MPTLPTPSPTECKRLAAQDLRYRDEDFFTKFPTFRRNNSLLLRYTTNDAIAGQRIVAYSRCEIQRVPTGGRVTGKVLFDGLAGFGAYQ